MFFVQLCVGADVIPFGYSNGANGPSNWGNLNPEWKVCNSGKQQSPINIVKGDAEPDLTMDSLTRDYANANATLINNGFNIMVRFLLTPTAYQSYRIYALFRVI